MVSISQIKQFSDQIGQQFHAEKVVLFGSHARGTADEDSDVDLLVILPFQGRSVDQSVAIRMELRPHFPLDILVKTPEQIKERLQLNDYFIREIMEEGKVLYETDNN